jgi:hypothetical protein
MIATSFEVRPRHRIVEIGGIAGACPPVIDVSDTPAGHKLPIDISNAFVAEVLKPYRANAKYLKSAQIIHLSDKTSTEKAAKDSAFVTGTGRFAIPESCYIDDTGHFNAVEFNICYNQLAYVLCGKCIELGILQKLNSELQKFSDEKANGFSLSMADYKRHQLPAMLIVSIEGVRFFKQLKSDDFRGALSINRVAPVGGAWFFFTTITFSDAEGVKAKGSVVLAFVPPKD